MPSAPPQDAIAAARQLLPTWVVWGNDLAFGLTVLLALGGLWLAVWVAGRPWQSPEPSHWSERARRANVVRVALRVGASGLPLMILVFSCWVKAPFSPLSRPVFGLALALSVLFIALRLRWRAEQQLGLPLKSFGDSLRHAACWALLFVPHVSIGFAVMPFAPPEFDRAALLLVAAAVTISLLLIQGGLRFRLARLLRLAYPASDRIGEIVRRAAEQTKSPVPGTIAIRASLPEVMAYRWPNCVSITDGAAALLTDAELESICEHQLAFMLETRHGSMWRTLTLAVAFPMLFPAIRPTAGTFGAVGVLVLVSGFVVLSLVLSRVTLRLVHRFHEQSADTANAGVYARALERVCELSLIPVVGPVGSIFPTNVYDRIVGAGVTPDYPRPLPPSRRRILAAIFLPLAPLALAFTLWAVALSSFVEPARKDEFAQTLGTMLPGYEAWSLHNLAYIRLGSGQQEAAVRLLRAAVELDRTTWQYPANLGGILSHLDRCDEARDALEEAKCRLSADPAATAEDKASLDECSQGLDDCYERSRQRFPLRRDAVTRITPTEAAYGRTAGRSLFGLESPTDMRLRCR